MKLVMTLLVRDEADIIAANIEFHLAQGVDFIIATDNLSEDGTAGILNNFERQGVLHYIRETDDNYAQHRWVTRMARLARTRFGADWVINNDADEFWLPAQGTLRQVLCATPAACDALSVQRANFSPRTMLPGIFFADAMVLRDRESRNALGEPLPGKVCHRAFDDIEVAQGNHAVLRDGVPLAAHPAPVTILHFPMRTRDQFANKIIKGGAAYGRNRELPPEIGWTWRHLYQLHLKGGLDAVWQDAALDDAAIAHGLRDGRIVCDRRLQQFFAARRAAAEAE